MKKLVLFDVDHTLIDVVNTHKNVFVSAFKKILNVDIDISRYRHHGYTDLAIIHELMDDFNIKKNPIMTEKIIKQMIIDFRGKSLDHSLLMPGAEDLLNVIEKNKNIIVGLVTGNLEEIAYAKLKHLKIDEYFILGGFGNISVIRSELVDFAIKQANKDFGKIDKKHVFIIGDTIKDIEAARGAGVKVIAVATGSYSYEELQKHKPDYLAKNLRDKKIIELITSG